MPKTSLVKKHYPSKRRVKRKARSKNFRLFKLNQDFIQGFVVAVMIGGLLLYSVFPQNVTLAATYTFTQTSWAGGVTANNAVHASNQTGWTEYSAKDASLSVVNAGADLQLGPATSSVAQTDDGSTNTGFALSGYAVSTTEISGTGASASVVLTAASSFTGVGSTVTMTGGSTNNLGQDVASGDVNGDGYDDMIVSEYGSDSVYIYYGGASMDSTADITLSETDTTFGASLASGDFNNDGYDDVLVGSNNDGIARGYIYYGGASMDAVADLTMYQNFVNYGISATVGDFNNDGYADAVLGSLAGVKVDIYYGGASMDNVYDVRMSGATGTEFGNAVASGDVNGDGYDDLVVGARLNDGTFLKGAVFVYYGGASMDSTADVTMTGAVHRDYLGYDVATGDVNGDGYADVIAGTQSWGDAYGARAGNYVRVYYGGASMDNTTDLTFTGTYNNWFGSQVASGDTNNDGYDDVIIGSYADTNSTGKVYVYHGASAMDTTVDVTMTGTATGDRLGIDVAVGNVNNDSFMDVLVGADDASGQPGQAYAYEMTQTTTYNSAGTFTSGAIDPGLTPQTWGNLSWTHTGGQTIALKVRTDADGNFSDATDWGSCGNITSGNDISSDVCVTDGHRYVQYQASLSTADTSVTPSLDDVTIGYTAYATSQTLTSSAYDAGDSANVIGGLSWEEGTLPANTTATISLRTAPDSSGSPGVYSAWSDFTNASPDCTLSTGTVTCTVAAIPSAMKDGSSDQWVQYKVTLTSDGANTPTLGQVVLTYVVNAPPEFDTSFGANGLTVSQISDSADANYGKMQIQYRVRDPDTTSGSSSPNAVTPTFEYNTGSGWTGITSGYLNAGATTNKTVEEINYTTYTAYWDVDSQITGTDTSTAQVRVTMNDNEAANNTATASDSSLAIDTTDPTVSTFTIDSTADTVTIASSDTNNLQYRLSNNSDFTADGLNATSGIWQTVGATSISTSLAWVFTGAPSYEVVYLEVRDAYGNVTSTSAKAPNSPATLDIKDVSNAATPDYREFISWTVYTPANGAAFSSYKIYRSTDGSSYSLLTTISDASVNYYADSSVSTGTTYYYKLQIVDADGDISGYTSVVSDEPDGQGGTDVTAPTISDITVATRQATWVKITWTTADELSNSFVDYSFDPSTAFDTTVSVSTMATSHTVTLTGLTPATDYLYQVRSADVFGNSATDDNSSAGYAFSTLPGATISSVATESVTDATATIFWNTDTDSNSYVVYATNTAALDSGVGVTEVGVATLVGNVSNGLYQHRVTLTGLAEQTPYYYYVKSTDGSSNTATDTNANSYYTFSTTYDNQPPVISDIATPVITSSIAVITWNTDELADSQVEYGTSSGVYSTTTVLDATLSISHAVTLSDLSTTTTYYYRIITKDVKGNSQTSDEQTFSTIAPETTTVVGGGCYLVLTDTTAPTINSIEVVNIDMFEAKVVFETNEVATGFVLYGETEAYGRTVASSEFLKEHAVTLTGLKPGITYHYRVRAIDKSGNIMTADKDMTFSTLVSEPMIESVELSETNAFNATVSVVTDVPTRAFILYGENEDYGYTSGSSELALSHAIKLVGLKLGTGYNFKVQVLDANGIVAFGENNKFMTKYLAEQGELVTIKKVEEFQENLEDLISSLVPSIKPPLVTDVKVFDITENSATVSWRTNIKTSSFVALATDEQYKPESGSTYQTEIGDAGERVKNHSVVLTNLLPDTLYHIQAKSQSILSIIGQSDDITFATKAPKINPKVVSVELDTLRVAWNTPEPSTSIVEYRNTMTGEVQQKIETKLTRYHDIILDDLDTNTVYGINVSGRNARGDTIEATRSLVVSTGRDDDAPIISGLKISSALMPGRNDRVQTVITWSTDEPATSVVEYASGAGAIDALDSRSDSGEELSTSHSIIINTLKPGSLYRLRVISVDPYGNESATPTRTIITPQKTESILDVIVKNFEESFGFLRR